VKSEFWKTYGGKLTPVGVIQHEDLGKTMRRKYLEEEGLLDPQDPDIGKYVHVFTSNSDRCLMSGQAFLQGMFPDVPFSFCSDDQKIQHELTGIVMRVQCDKDYTPVLHGFKHNPRYDFLKKKVFSSATEYDEWAKQPKMELLVEKLWKMTGFLKLSPLGNDNIKRLQCLTSVKQQIDIERAHKLPILHNSHDLCLDSREEKLIQKVTEFTFRYRYTGRSEEDQKELSRLATGLLPQAVVAKLDAATKDSRAGKGHFTLFSAHDNTLMALLAHMGFRDYPIPYFAAALCFELHWCDRTEEFFVRTRYSADPREQPLDLPEDRKQHVKSFKLPATSGIPWHLREEGDMLYSDFKRILMEERKSFISHEEWQLAAQAEEEAPEGTRQPAEDDLDDDVGDEVFNGDAVAGIATPKHRRRQASGSGHSDSVLSGTLPL